MAVVSAPRIKVLLEMGVHELDIDARDNQGRSAVHHAAAVGNYAAMEPLLANGANIMIRDFGKASTLHFTVNDPACVKLAIQKGSSTKAVDSHKRTPLHYFAMGEDPPEEVFDQLQEAGVDPNSVDSQGMTVFDYWDDAHVGYHSFEETTRSIELQLYGSDTCSMKEGFLRESNAQAVRDSRRFYGNSDKENRWCIIRHDEI